MQELENILDDDQDMEDMYLGRRRGEDAMVALEHMAYIAETYSEGTQTDDEEGSGNGDGVSSPAGPAAHSLNFSAVSSRIGPFLLAKRFAWKTLSENLMKMTTHDVVRLHVYDDWVFQYQKCFAVVAHTASTGNVTLSCKKHAQEHDTTNSLQT